MNKHNIPVVSWLGLALLGECQTGKGKTNKKERYNTSITQLRAPSCFRWTNRRYLSSSHREHVWKHPWNRLCRSSYLPWKIMRNHTLRSQSCYIKSHHEKQPSNTQWVTFICAHTRYVLADMPFIRKRIQNKRNTLFLSTEGNIRRTTKTAIVAGWRRTRSIKPVQWTSFNIKATVVGSHPLAPQWDK